MYYHYREKALVLRDTEYNISFVNRVSFLYTSLKMCKKTKQKLHCSTEWKQKYFHIPSHILCSKRHSIAALLSLTPHTWGHFNSFTIQQQCQNNCQNSRGVENIPGSQTFLHTLATPCTSVLTMSLQNCFSLMKVSHCLYRYFLKHISFLVHVMHKSFRNLFLNIWYMDKNRHAFCIPLVSANFWISARVFSSFLGQADTHKAIDLILWCTRSMLHGSKKNTYLGKEKKVNYFQFN